MTQTSADYIPFLSVNGLSGKINHVLGHRRIQFLTTVKKFFLS